MGVGGVNRIAVKVGIVLLLISFVVIIPAILSTSTDGLTSQTQAKDTPQTSAVPQKQTETSRSTSTTETPLKLSDQKSIVSSLESPKKSGSTSASTSSSSSSSSSLLPLQSAVIPAPTSTPQTSATIAEPESLAFRNSFSPSSYTGWDIETSGEQEQVTRASNYFECTVGGYESSFHYARLSRSLPSEDKLALTKNVSAELDFEIPDDFYEKQESFVRILSFDNYADFIGGTDQKIGSEETNEWRLGLVIYNSDKLIRLDSEHKKNESLQLWQLPSRLEPGRHQIKIEVSLSQTATGSWSVVLDGKKVGSATNVQTVPASLTKPQERQLTHISTCLDGSNTQDSVPLSLRIRSILTSGS